MLRLRWPGKQDERERAFRAAAALASDSNFQDLIAYVFRPTKESISAALDVIDPANVECPRSQGAGQVLTDLLTISQAAREDLAAMRGKPTADRKADGRIG
jgi:hypothetical protein